MDLAQQLLPLPSQSGQCNHQNHQNRSGDDGSKSLDLDWFHAQNQAELEREKVLEAMKEEYLDMNNPKKRVIGPLEKKLRFCFDWDNSDDTSRDMNPLYEKPYEACLLFGRGFRAGINDSYEQKQLAARNKEIHQELYRRKQGVKEHPEEATPSTGTSTVTGRQSRN